MNLKRMMLAVTMLIGLLIVDQARAAATPLLTQGTRSLNVAGSLDDDGEDLNVVAAASVGYFFIDYVEVGVNVSALIMGSDYKILGAGIFGEYSVDIGSPLVPFVGAGAELAWWDTELESDTVFSANGYGGARYFFVDYAAIGARLAVSVASEDIYNRGEDAADWTALVDTSWYF